MKTKSVTKQLIEYLDNRIKETPALKNNHYKKLKELLLGTLGK